MKKLLPVGLLLCGALWGAQAWAQTSAEIAGDYNIVRGINPDGSKYDGTVKIRPDASGGVTVTWDDGSTGVGMIEGNRLYVGMTFQKRSAVAAMTINKDGTIQGKWIQRTTPGMGIEDWKKR